jgi:hypothetical protein
LSESGHGGLREGAAARATMMVEAGEYAVLCMVDTPFRTPNGGASYDSRDEWASVYDRWRIALISSALVIELRPRM